MIIFYTKSGAVLPRHSFYVDIFNFKQYKLKVEGERDDGKYPRQMPALLEN